MAGRQIGRGAAGRGTDRLEAISQRSGRTCARFGSGKAAARYRVIYQATLADMVLVISAFEKKSQKTPKARDGEGAYQG